MDLIKFTISNPNNYIFPFLNLSQNKPKEGESVFVIGNPKGLDFSVSNGIVSSLRNDQDLGQLIQTTAPISSGNSGSPLINMKGEVVGVISFTLIEGQNLNFAVGVSNLFLLEEVNDLIFPPAKIESSNSNETEFRRFEWKTSSSKVLGSENLTLYEKKGSASDEYTLTYLSNIGGIDINIDYTFKLDRLTNIYIVPIRNNPNSTKGKWRDILTDFNSAYNEFATIEIKLMELVGQTFYECVGGIAYFCKDKNFYNVRTKLITKEEIKESSQAYFNEEQGNGFGYPTCMLFNRWENKNSNSIYTLGFTYWKEKSQDNNQERNCDWFLKIRPIQE
jgi:hypothetical protein